MRKNNANLTLRQEINSSPRLLIPFEILICLKLIIRALERPNKVKGVFNTIDIKDEYIVIGI